MNQISVDKVAGVPREVEVGGKVWKMSQITVGILAQVETWARALPYKRLKEKLELLNDAPKEIKADWYKQADEESKSKEYLQRELESMNGIVYMVRKCFEACHPDLSDDAFENIVSSVGIDVLNGFMERDNSIDGIDGGEAAEGKKEVAL